MNKLLQIRRTLCVAGLLCISLTLPLAAQEPPPAAPAGPDRPRQEMRHRRGPMREALMRDLFLRVAALPPEEQPRTLEEDPLFQRMPPTAQEHFRQRLADFNAQPPERRAEFLEQSRRGRTEHVGQEIFLRVAPLPIEAQQEALESDEAFAALPPHAQQRFRRHLEHFNSLPSDERARVLERMIRFRGLPPDRRQRLERRARRFAEISPEQREEARRAFDVWQQLPPERRQLLFERLRRLQAAAPDARLALANDEQFLSPLAPEERQLFHQLWHLREVLPQGRGPGPRR